MKMCEWRVARTCPNALRRRGHGGIGRLFSLLTLLFTLAGAPAAAAAPLTLSFDDVSSLGEYASLGVTFSPNASIWTHASPSVLVDPNGGAYSVPSALQFGNAGGELGSIFFAYEVSAASIWALSGPSADLLNAPMYMRAFDGSGNQLGEDDADPSLQFDFLSVSAPGIRRLDFFSPVVGSDVWDHLTFSPQPVSEPSILMLLAIGVSFLAFSVSRLGLR